MGLLRGLVRTAVVAGSATAVSGRVSHRQAGRWADQDQEPAEQDESADQDEPIEQPDDMSSKLAQLKQLGELKDSGVLTAAEFEQQKAQILAS